MPRRLLLLGAGGFLGRSIAHFVAGNGGAELVLNHRSENQGSAFDDVFESYALDLMTCRTGAIGEMVDRVAPDVVVNCAGLTVGQPDELRAANVGLVIRLIDELEGRSDVHLVHIGSAAEYGIQGRDGPVPEYAFAAPGSAYGVTKLEATERLTAAAAHDRISVTVLRVFNPLGRFSSPSTLPGNAALQIEAALRSGASSINLGVLDSRRDYIDTRDVARAVLAAASTVRHTGSVLNVGRGEAVASRYLVETLAAIAGFDGEIVETSERSIRSARVASLCADIQAITGRLDWTPQYNIEDSLCELWNETTQSREFASA
ncbi:MAG TPA: NAD(P)-dependent oxidoreductase [Ilumatobacteraceae bacterium]|jgi:nucleoside-diphosphate-sugar epimerase|nr:NAD(P)-dependent oxidoreductase [Ilumatobacteraceae bacterium]